MVVNAKMGLTGKQLRDWMIAQMCVFFSCGVMVRGLFIDDYEKRAGM